jgi:hypothetical protein
MGEANEKIKILPVYCKNLMISSVFVAKPGQEFKQVLKNTEFVKNSS